MSVEGKILEEMYIMEAAMEEMEGAAASVATTLMQGVAMLVLGTAIGIVGTLSIIWYILLRPGAAGCREQTPPPPAASSWPPPERAFPDFLNLPAKLPTEPESCLWLNLLAGFLFRELRDSIEVRRFAMKRLDKNFRWLVENTGARNFLEKLTVTSLHLGETMPAVDRVKLLPPKDGEQLGDGDDIEVAFDIAYTGAFKIRLHVDLVFGHNATATVCLHNLHGRMRLGIRRHPRPHYTLVFIEEPSVGVEVSSKFEGHSIPQLNSLLNSQIRKSIVKFHTLPAEKMRYEPLFRPPDGFGRYDIRLKGDKLHIGHITVTVIKARLDGVRAGAQVHCCVSLPTTGNKTSGVVEDRLVLRLSRTDDATSFGIVFRNNEVEQFLQKSTTVRRRCVISSVRTNSPGSAAGLKPGDVVMRIGQQSVYSPKQAIRLLSLVHLSVKIVVAREVDVGSGTVGGADNQDSAVAVYKTANVEPTVDGAVFQETTSIETTNFQSVVKFKVFDHKPHKKSIGLQRGKEDLLIGVASASLQDVALHCVSNPTVPYTKALAIQATSMPSSAIVGWLDVDIKHSHEPLTRASNSLQEFPVEATKTIKRTSQSTGSVGLAGDVESSSEPLPESKAELDNLMATIQSHIDLEAETRADLERQLDEASQDEGARLLANIKYSDERMHALAARMIRVVSALRAVSNS